MSKSEMTNFPHPVTPVAGDPDSRFLSNTHISFPARAGGCLHSTTDGIAPLWPPVLDGFYFKVIRVPRLGVFDIYSTARWAPKGLWWNSLFSSSSTGLFPPADRLLEKTNNSNTEEITRILCRMAADEAEMGLSRRAPPQYPGDRQTRRWREQTG